MKCGEVFCDRCGDCMYCYANDACYDEGAHSYEEREDSGETKDEK